MDFLILKEDKTLSHIEQELKNSFINIICNLVDLSLTTKIRSDPISNKYYNKTSKDIDYSEFLNLGSYFFNSKGGRGTLLQKAIESLTDFESGKRINQIIKNYPLNTTFDLMMKKGKTLTLIELKNRVDSGGTSARNESHPKFNKIIDTDTSILLNLGITEVLMIFALLFNEDGTPATKQGDRKVGFLSEEQSHTMELSKNGINFNISTQHGNEFLKNLDNKLNLDILLKTIFKRDWADLRIAYKLCLQERIRLQKTKNNIFTILKKNPNTIDFDKDFSMNDIKHGKMFYNIHIKRKKNKRKC